MFVSHRSEFTAMYIHTYSSMQTGTHAFHRMRWDKHTRLVFRVFCCCSSQKNLGFRFNFVWFIRQKCGQNTQKRRFCNGQSLTNCSIWIGTSSLINDFSFDSTFSVSKRAWMQTKSFRLIFNSPIKSTKKNETLPLAIFSLKWHFFFFLFFTVGLLARPLHKFCAQQMWSITESCTIAVRYYRRRRQEQRQGQVISISRKPESTNRIDAERKRQKEGEKLNFLFITNCWLQTLFLCHLIWSR